MMSDQAVETPMADHIEQFWWLLRDGKVRILVDTHHEHGFGGRGHWISASFPDDVAKALVAEHWALKQALGYPVPSDCEVINNPFRCGVCDARAQALPSAWEHPAHRWNVEPQPDGNLRVCRGEHGKYADCEYELYVRKP